MCQLLARFNALLSSLRRPAQCKKSYVKLPHRKGFSPLVLRIVNCDRRKPPQTSAASASVLSTHFLSRSREIKILRLVIGSFARRRRHQFYVWHKLPILQGSLVYGARTNALECISARRPRKSITARLERVVVEFCFVIMSSLLLSSARKRKSKSDFLVLLPLSLSLFV